VCAVDAMWRVTHATPLGPMGPIHVGAM
jgi:hypothetical protein